MRDPAYILSLDKRGKLVARVSQSFPNKMIEDWDYSSFSNIRSELELRFPSPAPIKIKEREEPVLFSPLNFRENKSQIQKSPKKPIYN